MKKGQKGQVIVSRQEIGAALNLTPETITKFLKSIGIVNRVLSSNDLQILRQHCHPLFYRITRLKLAKIYKQHPETLSARLAVIGISHQKKLSYSDLQNIYWKLGLPDWIIPLRIGDFVPLRENVDSFYHAIGATMPEMWYKFYYEKLGSAHNNPNSASRYLDPEALQYV